MAENTWLTTSRRGGGKWISPTFVMNPKSNIDGIRVRLDVKPEDFAKPDVSVSMVIETSPDEQGWRFESSTKWVGQSPPPATRGGVEGWSAEVNGLSAFAGQYIRVRFDSIGTFDWGVKRELLDISGKPLDVSSIRA